MRGNDIGSLDFRISGFPASLVLGGVIYVTLKFFLTPSSPMLTALKNSAEILVVLPVVLILPLLLSFIKFYHLRLWAKNTSLQSLRDMPYPDFRLLIAESLRREGFSVEERSGFDSDHGVDLELYKDGRRVAVLCRDWQSESVDAFQVQELYEAMLKDGANAALYITTGQFTRQARSLAQHHPVVLAEGKYLLDLVNPVRADQNYETARYLRRASLEPTY